MNSLLIGSSDKTEQLLKRAKQPFLLVDDGPIADAFLRKYKFAREFDPHKHSFNPLKGIDVPRARAFAEAVYGDKDLMTYRDGKRALTRMLLEATRLDKLPTIDNEGYEDAQATIDDLLLSPVLRQVLCGKPNFDPAKGSVVARIDRAKLGDFDAFMLGTLAIGQAQGQVIVPDFGFYGRPSHVSLIRQNRIVTGLNYLSEVPRPLGQALLTIKDKLGRDCVFEDAEVLASYAGLVPGTEGHTTFVQRAMGAIEA